MKTKRLLFILGLFSHLAYGQTVYISGPSSSDVDATETYWANWEFSPDEGEFNWWVDGGDVIYPDPNWYSSTSCRVTWTTGGDGRVWYSYYTWDNWWEESFPVIVDSPISLPATPILNNPTNITANSFTINWNSVTGATSYRIEVSTDPAPGGTLAYEKYTAYGTSDNVIGLSGGTIYYYRIRAVNEAGLSGYAMDDLMTLPATPLAYDATNITANSFTANWSSVTPNTDYYLLDVSTVSSFSSFVPGYSSLQVNASQTSQSVSGLSPGTNYYYRVRAENDGVESENSNNKGVLTIPSVTVGPATVCVNTGGHVYTTQTGMTGYSWSASGGTITSGQGTSSATVTWNTGGPQSVSIHYTNANGSSSVTPGTRSVTVNSRPTPSITDGLTVVCANTEGHVYTTQSGMTGYSWIATGGTITAGQGTSSATVTWNTSGSQNISVNYTNGNGCGSATPGALPVTVNPASTPSITDGPTAVCVDTEGHVYTTQTGMTEYSWVASGGTITAGEETSSATVTWTNSAWNISVHYTNEYGCSSSVPGTLSVTANPRPTPSITDGPTTVCANTGGHVYTTQSGMTEYSWSAPGGTITAGQGTSSATVTWNTSGSRSISVTYKNEYGCSPVTPGTRSVIVSPQSNGGTLGTAVEVYGSASGTLSVTGITGTIQKWQQKIGSGSWTDISETSSTLPYSNITTTTSFQVIVKSGACVSAASNAVAITVYPIPTLTIVGSDAIAPGGSTQIVAGSGFHSYEWYRDGSSMTGVEANTLNVTKPGRYKVSVKATSTSPTYTTAEVVIGSTLDQQVGVNYIVSTSFLKEGVAEQTDMFDLQSDDFSEVIQYFDGLGRHMQTVTLGNSPAGTDVVLPVVYDEFGREAIKYLSYSRDVRDGRYVVSPLTEQLSFYQSADKVAHDAIPYSETIFEQSPLNRVLKQGAPGVAWQPDPVYAYTSSDRTIKMAYETNASEEVLLWTLSEPADATVFSLVNATIPSAPIIPIYYDPSQLYKNKMKDEEGNEVIEYKNKKDQVVLKRVQATAGNVPINDSTYASTYYIFDDFGNLACVIPPQAVYLITKTTSEYFGKTDSEKENFLKRWAFRYSFDKRNRMTMKQVPGAEPVYMVYDNRDRLVLTQNGNQRSTAIKYWSFIKYDLSNRPVMTGIKDTTVSLSQPVMQSALDMHYAKAWTRFGEEYIGSQAGNVHGYSNKSYPVVTKGSTVNPNDFLTISYYDDYSFRNMLIATYPYIDENLEQTVNGVLYSQPNIENATVKGQLTGSKTKVLDGVNSWLNIVNYFDEKGRLIQSVADNYLGGQNRTTNLYDFTGKLLQTKSSHFGWKDQLHVTAIGNTLKNSTSFVNSWGTSGTASYQQLRPGEDGWIEVVVSETTTGRMIGFSQTNANANYTTIDYALYLKSGGTAEVYEKSVFKASMGSAPTGTILRVERVGTTVKYYLNNVLKYTSQQASTSSLLADVAFNHQNATLTGIRISFGTTVLRRMEYDLAGRLLKTWHKVNSGPEILLSSNKYNEIGQLIDKKLHSTVSNASDAKQSVDYRYNIRGWLTSMNDSELVNNNLNDDTGDYFGFELGYNENIGAGNTSMFNGNISGMKWSRNLGLSDKKASAYNYSYDAINRITGASYKEKETTWELAANSAFSESNYSYDLNGNILGLTRYDERGSSAPMDKIVYSYGAGTVRSNKLLRVSETTGTNGGDKFKGFIDGANTGDDYIYDPNGNMTKDENKSITTIGYNYINLPLNVTKSNGNRVSYIYDAVGKKLKQEVVSDSTFTETFYNGDAIYARDIKEDNVLQDWSFTSTKEGWVTNSHTSSYIWSNGTIQANVTNTDPTITSPVVSVPITASSIIKLRMKVNAPVYSAQVFFTTTASTGISESKSIRFALVAQNDSFHEYVLDLSNNPFWTGNLRTLRIDPANPGAAGNSFAIDYVRIVSTSEVPDVALQFLNHDEGRVVMTSLEPEYQYHLKDHLGNVRLTFTTVPSQDVFMATSEAGHSQTESSDFPNYDDVTFSSLTMYNHTDEAGATRSVVLNGAENKQVGLAKSIRVIPGDTINMEVYAKFYNPGSSESAGTLIATAMTSAFGLSSASIGSEYSAYQALNGLFNTGWVLTAADWEDVNAPKAFLNYILFDENFTPYDMGWDQIDIQAAVTESTPNPDHNLLALQAIVREPGYIYIYFSNEDDEIVEVYFDDLNIQHKHGPVVQADSYYPFGLTFNSYRRQKSVANRYLYNQGTGEKTFKTERVFDLGFNIDLTKYRAYDPAIGRWWQVDPLADLGDLVSLTPYNYAFNNPIRYNDPEGDCPCLIPFLVEAIVAVAEGATIAAGGTAATALVLGVAEKSNADNATGAGYSPAVGFAMSSSRPGEISSPYFLNNKSKTDGPPNPDGAKGKPDHQEKVKELEKKAQGEAEEGETVLTEKKIQNENSNRRPDVQIVDKDGKTRKVMEAERKPNSLRNIKREEEYRQLGVEQETHRVGGAPTDVPQ